MPQLVVAAIAKVTFAAVVKFVVTTVLSIGISRLLAKRAMKKATAGGDAGARIQLPPSTDNKIPVVYGSALVSGPIIDAKISTDLKTMWVVVALAEHTDTTVSSGYTYDMNNVYYDGKRVIFDSPTGNIVTALENNTTPPQQDTKVNGQINIYLFTNGSSSGYNTGGQTAAQIISVANGVPSGQEWTATEAMTNCAFAIMKVKFNSDAGTTGIGGLLCKITNSINKPGDAIKDYLLNTRYGCGIPLTRIDTASLTALNTYSDELITYVPVGGGSATQARYRINGPVDTGQNCLTNLQLMVDTCDSWLQYSELTGQWKVVINQSYTDYTTLGSLYLVDNDNLVSGIEVNPVDLNDTYNEVEVAYPNRNIKDQSDFQVIELSDFAPEVMSPNEAINRLNVQLPLVNEAVQAKYLALRRLLQSREVLVIGMALDYSGIQLEAGDVIRVGLSTYGWGPTNANPSNPYKLFRISQVSEEKYPDGSLGVRVQAFEYNDTIYADNAIEDFVPSPDTGLDDPNIISVPDAPQILVNDLATINTFQVFGNVPDVGLVTNLNFNFGTDSNTSNHTFFSTINNANGAPLTNSDSANSVYNTYSVDVSTLPTGNYYWSIVARNQTVGISSNASNVINWGGTNVGTPNTTSFCNATSNGTTITSDALPFDGTGNNFIGSFIKFNLQSSDLQVVSGTGQFAANTRITSFTSNTQYTINNVPTVPLSNACIKFVGGGIFGNNIQANTVTGNNIQANTVTGNNIQSNTVTSNNMTTTGVTAGCYTNPSNVCVDAAGRITSIANGTGGSGTLTIQDQGVNVVSNVSIINFTGNGANVSNFAGVANVDIIAVGAYMQVADNQMPVIYGDNGTNAFSTVSRASGGVATLRIPAQLEFYNSGGSISSQAYSLAADDYDPFFTNTSSTTNNFWANTTLRFQPERAAYQRINVDYTGGTTIDGYEGWIVPMPAAIDSSFTGANYSNQAFLCQSSVQLVSDANTTVQVGGTAQFKWAANNVALARYVNYGTVTTIDLIEKRPQTVNLSWVENGYRVSNISGNLYVSEMALAVRNPGSGNVWAVSGNAVISIGTNGANFNDI